jgi:N-acetylmuramoyl-L-alanine amidase
MRKLYIVAGHSNDPKGDRGAYANGVYEGDLTIELRDYIIQALKGYGVIAYTDDNSNALIGSLKWLKSLVTPNDIAIELHFNSGSINAVGTEALIPYRGSIFEKITARDLVKITSEILHTNNRGIKDETLTPRKKLGWMRLECETIILEVCFISNKGELDFYKFNATLLAKNIAEYLIKQINN